MKRYAFTMLELIFVIVVLGILAVLAMPKFERDPLAEAAEQIARHIRYTQHLAMTQDLYSDQNQTWYKSMWRIRFYTNSGNVYYTVFSDQDQNGNADYGVGKREIAIDPIKKINMHVSNDNRDMDLTTTYGITSVSSTCDNGFIDLFFDSLGRPYVNSMNVADPSNPFTALLPNDCNVTIVHPIEGTANIQVNQMTGLVSVFY